MQRGVEQPSIRFFSDICLSRSISKYFKSILILKKFNEFFYEYIYKQSIYVILLNKSCNIHRQDIIFFEDCILSILSDSILTLWPDNPETMPEKNDG